MVWYAIHIETALEPLFSLFILIHLGTCWYTPQYTLVQGSMDPNEFCTNSNPVWYDTPRVVWGGRAVHG